MCRCVGARGVMTGKPTCGNLNISVERKSEGHSRTRMIHWIAAQQHSTTSYMRRDRKELPKRHIFVRNVKYTWATKSHKTQSSLLLSDGERSGSPTTTRPTDRHARTRTRTRTQTKTQTRTAEEINCGEAGSRLITVLLLFRAERGEIETKILLIMLVLRISIGGHAQGHSCVTCTVLL